MNYNMVYGEYMMSHYRAYWEDQVIARVDNSSKGEYLTLV